MHQQPTPAATRVQERADTPDLAIVILSYNTCDLLRNCLRAVFQADESVTRRVCVVDNRSSDESVAMVQAEFPQVHLIPLKANLGFSAGNNVALRWFGYGADVQEHASADTAYDSPPRYALLLNADTVVPPNTFADMVAFMDAHPAIGVAGPRVRRPDGSLDRACRRSFPTPTVSFYRLIGLSRLFPNSPRFNAYNLDYLPETSVHAVDAVVGAYMQVRREAIAQVGLLDEAFFMYGEDLDWAKRFKDAGWEVWYNGASEITHVKEASSSQSTKSRIDFHEAMWIFYRKHYQAEMPWLADKAIRVGIVAQASIDIARRLWRFCGAH